MTMDNGMDVQDNAWAQIGRQLAAKDRIIRDLIDERDDHKACAENWEANAKKWSDDWHEIRDERDALAAHVERLRDVIQVVCEQACGRIPEAAADALEEVWREPGETSLSRLKAQWQAEALELFASGIRAVNDEGATADLYGMASLMDVSAAQLRRQAQEAP